MTDRCHYFVIFRTFVLKIRHQNNKHQNEKKCIENCQKFMRRLNCCKQNKKVSELIILTVCCKLNISEYKVFNFLR